MRVLLCFAVAIVIVACSSAATTSSSGAPDGGEAGTTATPDSSTGPTDSGADTAPVPQDDGGIGQTCVGYGAGETCGTEPGKPYGYVCFDGAPPSVKGCKITRQSGTLGNNYCCEENVCVEQVDQGAQCNSVSGKPRRFQCPPTDSGNAAPPSGCVEHNSGTTELEKFYCCP